MRLVNYSELVLGNYYQVYFKGNEDKLLTSDAILLCGKRVDTYSSVNDGDDATTMECNARWIEGVLNEDYDHFTTVFKTDTFYELDEEEILKYIVMECL